MSKPAVRQLAKGRVYTGRQAVRLGLVDEEGGLSRALAIARKESGLPDDSPVVECPPRVEPRILKLIRQFSPRQPDGDAATTSTYGGDEAPPATAAAWVAQALAHALVGSGGAAATVLDGGAAGPAAAVAMATGGGGGGSLQQLLCQLQRAAASMQALQGLSMYSPDADVLSSML